MKKLLIPVIIICLILTGCGSNNSTTKTKKEEPLTFKTWVSNHGTIEEFKCPSFYESDVAFADTDYFITMNGKFYKVGNFSDGTNCKLTQDLQTVSTDIKIIPNYDRVRAGSKYYTLDSDGSLSEMTSDVSLYEKRILDDNSIIYYLFSYYANDVDHLVFINNVFEIVDETYRINYEYDVEKYEMINQTKTKLPIDSTATSKILFALEGEDEKTGNPIVEGIATDKNFYYYQEVKENNCDKYDDIACPKQFVEDKKYPEYIKDIAYVNSDLFFVSKDNYYGSIDMDALMK